MKVVVDIYEYELGWSPRRISSREFPVSPEGVLAAKDFQINYNKEAREVLDPFGGSVPDQYFKAHEPRLVY